MDSETPVLKWTAAAVGVILVCFCLGYFVFGPSARPGIGGTADANVIAASPDSTPSPVQVAVSGPGLIVDERTSEIEAKQAKVEEAAKEKAAAEAKKKADADAKTLAEKAAADASLATASPSPSPSPGEDPTPDPNNPNGGATADNGASPTKDPAQPTTPAPDITYRVRVGSYASRDSAKGMATELNGRGYATIIVADSGDGKATYHLQVGAYRDKKAADATQQELQANGYDATVSN